MANLIPQVIIPIAGALLGGLFSSSSARSNAAAAEQAARLQWDIADRIQKREQELFDIWKQDYLPCEQALRAEVCSMPVYEVQYDTAAQRAITQVRRQFSRARRDALACLDTHCAGAYCGLTKDLAIAEANAAAWAATTAMRTEEALKFQRDQQRREEQHRITNTGRQAYQQSRGAEIAANIAGTQAGAARQAASNQSAAAGYFLQQAFRGFGGMFPQQSAMTAPTGVYQVPVMPDEFGFNPDAGQVNVNVFSGQNLADGMSLDDALLAGPFDTPMI